MFSVITNIYNKKTKWNCLQPQENWKSFFWQLEMFAVCTTGDTAHSDTIFRFLPHMGASICFTAAMMRAFRSARSHGKRLHRTLHTALFNINCSLAAVPVDFLGLCRKLAWTHSTLSSEVNGRPLDFCLHRHPVSVNCLYHAQMVLSAGRSFL